MTLVHDVGLTDGPTEPEAPEVTCRPIGRSGRRLVALVPGVAAAAAIAAVASVLGGLVPMVGAPVLAIVAGIIVSSARPPAEHLRPGLAFSTKAVLQGSIVVLGLGLSFGQVVSTGESSLPVLLGTLVTALGMACFAGRALHLGRDLNILIGVGTVFAEPLPSPPPMPLLGPTRLMSATPSPRFSPSTSWLCSAFPASATSSACPSTPLAFGPAPPSTTLLRLSPHPPSTATPRCPTRSWSSSPGLWPSSPYLWAWPPGATVRPATPMPTRAAPTRTGGCVERGRGPRHPGPTCAEWCLFSSLCSSPRSRATLSAWCPPVGTMAFPTWPPG